MGRGGQHPQFLCVGEERFEFSGEFIGRGNRAAAGRFLSNSVLIAGRRVAGNIPMDCPRSAL